MPAGTVAEQGIFIIVDDEVTSKSTSCGPYEYIKVAATDVSAKTITVDGGNWDSSNQVNLGVIVLLELDQKILPQMVLMAMMKLLV